MNLAAFFDSSILPQKSIKPIAFSASSGEVRHGARDWFRLNRR